MNYGLFEAFYASVITFGLFTRQQGRPELFRSPGQNSLLAPPIRKRRKFCTPAFIVFWGFPKPEARGMQIGPVWSPAPLWTALLRKLKKICLTAVEVEPTTFDFLVECSTTGATKSNRFEPTSMDGLRFRKIFNLGITKDISGKKLTKLATNFRT